MRKLRTRISELASAAIEDRPRAVSTRAVAVALAVVLAFALAAGVRLYRLDRLPGEWYGDISTLYEYTASIRELHFPPSLYDLGVGPLYPIVLGPWLQAVGVSYFTVKLAAVLWSLAALAALYWLCRQLLGDGFALIATVVAGTGSWLLVFSRLGDVEAGVALLTVAPLALVVHLVDRRPERGFSAVLCGVTTGAALYLYGAAFAVPIVVTVTLVACTWLGRPPRLPRRLLGLYLAGLTAGLAPMAIAFARAPQAFIEGHVGTRAAHGPGALATVARNGGKAMLAYVTRGATNFRGNPPDLPHVDRLGLALAILGVVFWLRPGRRKWGAVLIGGFFAMHLPSIATGDDSVPSAARTIAAAPLLYILVATGIWWLATLVRGWWGHAAGAVTASILMAAFVAINLHRYFSDYAVAIPYDGTPVARALTTYVDLLPPETTVYLVGSTWTPGGMPEPKSILYTMRKPRVFEEQYPDSLDCKRLAELHRPAVLVWSPAHELPSPWIARCGTTLAPQLFSSKGGLPMFQAAALPGDRQATAAAPEPAPVAPIEESAPQEPSALQSANILLDGVVVEMRYQRLDMGQPSDLVDGNPDSLMRGAGDNPYTFELHYSRPRPIAAISLELGHLPEYRIDAVVTAADGSEHRASVQDKPPFGNISVELTLPDGAIEATAVTIAITDIRERPREGWHIHLVELQLR